jgi:hypothetical protein
MSIKDVVIEKIFELVIDLAKPYYISFRFKIDRRYKVIQLRLEKIFDSYDKDFKNIFLEFIESDIVNQQNQLILKNFFDWNLCENVDKNYKEILKHPIYWEIINRYFLENEDLKKIIEDIKLNITSFRDTFDKQIWLYFEWGKVNKKLLEKEKSQAISSLWEWIKKLEEIIIKQIIKFKEDLIPNLLYKNDLPITQIEIEEINENILKESYKIDKKLNYKMYDKLLILLDRMLDDIIWILILSDEI